MFWQAKRVSFADIFADPPGGAVGEPPGERGRGVQGVHLTPRPPGTSSIQLLRITRVLWAPSHPLERLPTRLDPLAERASSPPGVEDVPDSRLSRGSSKRAKSGWSDAANADGGRVRPLL